MKGIIKIIFIVILIAISILAVFIYSSSKKNKPIDITTISEDPDQNEIPNSNPQNQEKITTILQDINVPKFPDRKCPIEKYGARSGGETLNTEAINKAINDCSSKGGGTVTIPKGRWLSGAIKLKSNINLNLDIEAELVFTDEKSEYLPAVFSRYQGIELYNYSPPIYAQGVENVAITGKGKINGNGKLWWKWAQITNSEIARDKLFEMSRNNVPVEDRQMADEKNGLRPSFIQAINSKNIFIDGITISDGPMWTLHFVYSENIYVKNTNINTNFPNTDGIVIDSSKDVLIENSNFSTGDDAIAIKSGLEEDGLRVNRPSENVVLRNNNVIKGHGGVAIGSELSGGVKNVYIFNSNFITSDNGFRIKATDSRGGYIQNVLVDGIKMENIVDEAIIIDMSYDSKLSSSIDRTTFIKNISIQNININGASKAIAFVGIPNDPIENFTISNVTARTSGGFYINKAKNISFDGIDIKITDSEPYFNIRDSQNIKISGFMCPDDQNYCFEIKGKTTDGIYLESSNFDQNRINKEEGFWGNITFD